MELKRGDRLGSYEIRGDLGSGGMGQVFYAYDLRLQRDVALKVIADRINDRDAIRRFQNEARVHVVRSILRLLSGSQEG